jgi:hypothetical protein
MAISIVLARCQHFGVVSRFTIFELNLTTTQIRAWTQEKLIVFLIILAAPVGLRTLTKSKIRVMPFHVAGKQLSNITFIR